MRIHKIAFAAALLAYFAGMASAQTTGTITVSGSVPAAVSITDTTNTVNFNDVTSATFNVLNPNTLTALQTKTASFRLRSNKSYKLTASSSALVITNTSGFVDQGGNAITLADIGFGVKSVDSTGANVVGANSHNIATGYDVSGGWGAAVSNGISDFSTAGFKTLNNITGAGADILTGGRISKQGNLTTNNNFLLVGLEFAILPQYFTPNDGFSATVTLTVATT